VILTASDPVQVRHGRGIVEISAAEISKGAAVMRLLEESPADVVLVAGDDLTDESMYRLDIPNLISIRIGPGETHARYWLPTPGAMRRLLDEAANAVRQRVGGGTRDAGG
jgi:trehalose-phosphatase